MPPPADEPLRRCNVYLYQSDWDFLYRRYGHGVSDHIRRAVRNLVNESKPVTVEGLLKGTTDDE